MICTCRSVTFVPWIAWGLKMSRSTRIFWSSSDMCSTLPITTTANLYCKKDDMVYIRFSYLPLTILNILLFKLMKQNVNNKNTPMSVKYSIWNIWSFLSSIQTPKHDLILNQPSQILCLVYLASSELFLLQQKMAHSVD